MPRRRPQPTPPPPPPDVDLNQVVAYNVRAARELRGWTQEEVSERLEPYLGQRLTQAGISAIERAWDGDRRREFDAQEILEFAMVFDLPMLWFLLPPPGDHRLMTNTNRPVDELYMHLLGRPEQLEPLYARLREIGVTDPTAAERTVENITGQPARSRQWSYGERRKELLLALLDQHADDLDNAIDQLADQLDHLRQIGIRGFIAEHTNDDDYAEPQRNSAANTAARGGITDRSARGGTKKKAPAEKSARRKK
jgi:transcriptional regulator with XRE-family HTH domain